MFKLTFGNENALKGEHTVEPMKDFAGVVSADGTTPKLSGASSSPRGNLIGVNPEDWLNGSCRIHAEESLIFCHTETFLNIQTTGNNPCKYS